MSRCKLCKTLEDEELAVHLWETHGLRGKDIEELLGWQNPIKMKELMDKHKETGKKSAYRFKRNGL